MTLTTDRSAPGGLFDVGRQKAAAALAEVEVEPGAKRATRSEMTAAGRSGAGRCRTAAADALRTCLPVAPTTQVRRTLGHYTTRIRRTTVLALRL